MFNLEDNLRTQQAELEQLRDETDIEARRAEINQLLTMVTDALYALDEDMLEVSDIKTANDVKTTVCERLERLKADLEFAGTSGEILEEAKKRGEA